MEQKISLSVLGIIMLFGVFLLKGGMTGNVISESCCFGPGCAPENICAVTGASIESPALMSAEDATALSGVGLLLVVISASMVFGYLKNKADKENKS